MGAFFLSGISRSELDENNIVKIFTDLEFNISCIRQFGQFKLYFFKKKLIDNINFFEDNEAGIYVAGTLIYKNHLPEDSLKILLVDLRNNKVDFEDILGHFFAIYLNNQKLHYFSDDNNIYDVYFNDDNKIVSSSFLAMVKLFPDKLTINKDILIENLTTGGIIGEESIFNQLKRLFKSNLTFLQPVIIKRTLMVPELKSYKEGVSFQIENIRKYYEKIKLSADYFGGDLGITGGYDSRLLMAVMSKSLNNFQYHSSKRNYDSVEFNIAKMICEFKNYPFATIDVKPTDDYSAEDYDTFLLNGMKYFDGMVRTHLYWHEGYGNLDYRKKILKNKRFGLNGVGGEQYRNSERLPNHDFSFKNWIYKNFLGRVGVIAFKSKKDEKIFIDNYFRKILSAMDLPITYYKTDRVMVKRFFNEVWNSANRAVRAKTENMNTYYLSPFADGYLSKKSCLTVKYFDNSLDFEGDMISSIDKSLAEFASTYGYNFYQGEPRIKSMINMLFDFYLPAVIKNKIKMLVRPNNRFNINLLLDKYKNLAEYYEMVNSIDNRIDLKMISQKHDLYPLILYWGFFFKKFEQKIKF